MPYHKTILKKKELFDLLLENSGYKEMRSAVDKFLGRPIWWASQKNSFSSIRPLTRAQRAHGVEDHLLLSEYKNAIARAMGQSGKQRSAVAFSYALNNTYGISIPLFWEGKSFGFFGACGLKTKAGPALLDIITGYSRIVINEIYKDSELSRVYELVRPRAIALSTVHTIHRLISSTLDIKELFPRIARLSLQVLKAERVSISMLDKESKKLTCVASVNDRKSKDVYQLKSRSTPIEKKVAYTGRSIFKKNVLCVPLVEEDITGVISVRDKVGKERFSIFDHEILTTLAEQAVIAIRNAQMFKEQEDLTIGTVRSLAYLLDAKFPRIYTHTEFFIELILELGRVMGLKKDELKILHYSALLPDLGKVVMPEEILKKPKGLSGKERKILKTHTLRGIEVLKYLDVLKPVIPIILHHHEKYDGTGYPDKLKGRHIPLGSRIMAVVDSFEAMVCHRPYRKSMPFRMAASEIRRQSGKQFDPEVVKEFMDLANSGKLEGLIRRHAHDLKKVL
ncbi:MAG: HD domain-containing phosphohydrolase [Candidatus Omnitrophota bacterium]